MSKTYCTSRKAGDFSFVNKDFYIYLLILTYTN